MLFKECVSDPGVDTECRPERGDSVHREQCIPTPDAVPPSSAASVVTEAGVLPDAIAPSLASTPEFARRNTSWCHAIEVRFCYVVHYNAEQFYATEQNFLFVENLSNVISFFFMETQSICGSDMTGLFGLPRV